MRGECLKTSSTRQWTRLSERQLSSRFAHLRTQALIGAVILPVSCAAGAAGVGLSTLELLGKVADTPPEKRLDIQKVDEDDEFSWNVSTAVSFIPGFNWMVWFQLCYTCFAFDFRSTGCCVHQQTVKPYNQGVIRSGMDNGSNQLRGERPKVLCVCRAVRSGRSVLPAAVPRPR